MKYLHFSVCSGTETEKGPWLELQFSLVDNSKLNLVYLLNRISFTSRRFTRWEKDCFMPKGIKQSPLEKVLLKSAEKYIRFSLKDSEVPQTLEYKGGQLNAALVIEVENFTNWKKRFMCHIIGIEPQFKNIISNSLFVPMAAGHKKPEAQWITDERKTANLDQHLKNLIMSVLPDDQINSVINCLTAKSTWDGLIQYDEGPPDVKESRVMDIKLCYNTFKTQTFTRIKVLMNELDFQDSPDDEDDTRSSHEFLKDLEEEYQAKYLLAKSKRFFKKDTQRFSSPKATNQSECHKCCKKGHFARDCWSKTSVPSYQSPFQPKLLHSYKNKPKMRNTKDFEAKYNKVKAKLAFLGSSASAPSSFSSKNKGEDSTLPNHNSDEIPSNKSQRNITDPSVVVSDSPVSNYDLANEYLVCSTPLLPLKKLNGAEASFGPKTVNSILKSKSTFKAETLKGIKINEPSSAPARGNKSSLGSKTNSAPTGKLNNVNVKDDPPHGNKRT
nr:hypothetical protein [Tanacetum cinerariifolium]